ncbi:MAG: response regulator [Planctomycetota bacterium]|jgi:DNA-binding NarL/FixJ family response regulator
MSINILLADDHGIIREGLRSLLEKLPDIKVVGEAQDGRKAVELVQELLPDIVIIDISMPNLNGIDATRQIMSKLPEVKVIGLSIHSNRRFVANMLKAGAVGYILKESFFEEVSQAIQTVTANGIYLSPKITSMVVDDYVNRLSTTLEPKLETLTTREREVLQLLAEGKTTKQIAADLYVSTKAIEANRRQLMSKLDIHNVAELTKYAIREGLTSLES